MIFGHLKVEAMSLTECVISHEMKSPHLLSGLDEKKIPQSMMRQNKRRVKNVSLTPLSSVQYAK